MKKKNEPGFINDVREDDIIMALKLMETDVAYLTEPAYRGSSVRWDDNYVSFVDYHLNYLRLHPSLAPDQYLSNLRLKLRKSPIYK